MKEQGLFGELVFATPRLQLEPSQANSAPFVSMGIRGSARTLQFGAPWFLRQPPQGKLAHRWSSFCGVMRAHRIPMFCSVDQFEQVSATDVPIRLAKRIVGQPFVSQEVRTADVLEIDCFDPETSCWQWPTEVFDLQRLKTFVQTIRDATGGFTPIGMSLPVGLCRSDLESCILADLDFLTLVGGNGNSLSAQALLIDGLSRARTYLDACNCSALPVLVVTELHDPEHALKLLALGATAVSIDSLVNPLISDPRPSSAGLASGMLKGIDMHTASTVAVPEVESLLSSLNKLLESRLRSYGLANVQGLDRSYLRAISEQVSRLADVALLAAAVS